MDETALVVKTYRIFDHRQNDFVDFLKGKVGQPGLPASTPSSVRIWEERVVKSMFVIFEF